MAETDPVPETQGETPGSDRMPVVHALDAADALELVASTPDGLSSEEATRRLNIYGPNRSPEPKKRSTVLRFLAHFHNVLIYVLIGSAIVTAALQHWVDTGVIMAVVLVNAVIGFLQEGRAERARSGTAFSLYC